jgi:positive regulator of sigma E activity
MQNYWIYLIYFGAGVIQDITVTFYYQFVSEKKALRAAMLSFLITLINLTILYGILSNLNPDSGIFLIATYALGNATGAYLAIRFPKILSQKNKFKKENKFQKHFISID